MSDDASELGMKMPGDFTFAAVGDMIQMQPFTRYANADTQALLDVMRNADVTVANLEAIIVDEDRYTGPIGDIRAPTSVAQDFVAMGIDMMTKANNHAFDMGEEGFWECLRHIEDFGIVHCGAGRNLRDSRKARYFTSDKGIVGMAGIYASSAKRGIGGDKLPSVNTLRVEPAATLTPDQFTALSQILEDWEKQSASLAHPAKFNNSAEELTFVGKKFRLAEESGRFAHTMDEEDLKAILHAVKTGKQLSDFFIATIHWHENRYAFQHYTFDHYPADYQVEFAHKAIDAGADAVMGHGVHTIKGIEIYKGRPICYGLSNFVFQQQISPYSWTDAGIDRPWGDLNAERFGWLSGQVNLEALLIEGVYKDGNLSELRIYPADLGPERVGSRLGIPQLADEEKARELLGRVAEYSQPFGTRIDIEGRVGVIRMNNT